MIDGKSVLAIIPARGGSKGVLRKNIRLVAGKPLIAWTIEEAKKSKHIDRIILSSDDEEIISIARQWNCEVPFIRPPELAQDNVSSMELILHALENIHEKFDYLILLQPTSPLRLAEDIDGCIEKCYSRKAPACVSVNRPEKSPYWMYYLDDKERMTPLIKQNSTILFRQKLPEIYALNGAVYVAKVDWFITTRKFVSDMTIAFSMPELRSLDVDTEFDLKVCEIMLSDRKELSKV